MLIDRPPLAQAAISLVSTLDNTIRDREGEGDRAREEDKEGNKGREGLDNNTGLF